MDALTTWQVSKLTTGTEAGQFHSHAYYDIPVFDATSRFVTGHQVRFAERQPTRKDPLEIGYIDLESADRAWVPIGESRAWSWQQGAMSQWLPNSRTIIWNDRQSGAFIARTYDLETGAHGQLPRPVYAVDPTGRFALSLNMGRLKHVRPGYGYPDGPDDRLRERMPKNDGVWRLDLQTGRCRLILSVRDAVRFLYSRLSPRARLQHLVRRYIFWFNHAKIAPDGERFTVKLRFRSRDLRKPWRERMGVSLTCGTDGKDLRLLADATSHVIWLDPQRLYLWRRPGVFVYRDERPEGCCEHRLAPGLLRHNVHIRHLPGAADEFVFDTPYHEDIDLFLCDATGERQEHLARFGNHRPRRGLYRCDLHPCPSPDGRKILVTSLHDGGRQMYLLAR